MIRAQQHALGARRTKGASQAHLSRLAAAGVGSRPSFVSARTRCSRLSLTSDGRHDLTAVPEHLDGVRLKRTLVMTNRSYVADGLRSRILLHGALPVILDEFSRRVPIAHEAPAIRPAAESIASTPSSRSSGASPSATTRSPLRFSPSSNSWL